MQRILRHSSITVTTRTYVEVIETVKRDALDSMATLFESGWRRFVRPVVVNEAAVVVTVVVKTLESPTRKTAIFLVELRDSNPIQNLYRQVLSCGGCSFTLLRDVSVSCGYASPCYANSAGHIERTSES